MSYQKLVIVGNLGRDPELRYSDQGEAFCNFTVATNYSYKDRDGNRVKKTTWFRVSVSGGQAEACNTFLSVGSQVLVEGTLTADQTTGGPRMFERNDGTVGANFEIRASRVVFLASEEREAEPLF